MSKDTFLNTPIAPVHNHVPSVDLGAFDLSLDQKKHRADVLIKVHLVVKGTTSPSQLIKFGNRFQKVVPEVWNKKVRIVCTKAGWNDVYLDPSFEVQIVNLVGSHFRIKVVDENDADHVAGPFALVTQKEHVLGGGAFSPRKGRFGVAANHAGEMGSYRTNIIYDLSRSPLLIPIKGSVTRDPVGRQRLEKFAREVIGLKVSRTGQSSKRPTLTITGCGPGDRAHAAQDAKSWLVATGIKNPIVTLASGDTGKPAGVMLSFDNDELKRLFPAKPASTNSLFRQVTVAHEFGHMLGLPDEYLCMHSLTKDAMQNIYAMTAPEAASLKGNGMQIADVKQMPDGSTQIPHIVGHQRSFVTLCKRAGLAPPEFGRMTPSMMSNGMVLHPYHFVTVWEAICQATGFEDWRIAMR